jgi:S1-C subfamily serine protease
VLTFAAQLESGVQLPTVLDFYSRGSDLALLVVPGLTGWAAPLPVIPGNRLRVGQRVYAVGSPLGLDHTFTSGVVSALRPETIQTDATVHSGSSGGPLLDAGGAVCGVITSTHKHKDMSFALYGDAVFALLEERRAFNAGVSKAVKPRPDL